ncbi:NUDIX domain-containing protein [Candidatus Nomurabacteria bacterium]|nr:NUDIX domain-containing protein [Candidatus Nomurabacteria bacterium]MCB9820901.1 NUDIX domain-containing protein [Candidatus Nomurabacteria bacterium]
MTKDTSYGVIPIVKKEDSIKFLILHQKNGHWSFPKGHMEEGEDDIQAALREFGEETGLREIRLDEENIFQEVYTYEKDGEKVEKTNYFFLGYLDEELPLSVQEAEVIEYKYATLEEAMDTFTFEAPKELLIDVNGFILSQTA